jgi:hypothetical protein
LRFGDSSRNQGGWHRNPVNRGLVLAPEQWPWSSFRSYAYGEAGAVLINQWELVIMGRNGHAAWVHLAPPLQTTQRWATRPSETGLLIPSVGDSYPKCVA